LPFQLLLFVFITFTLFYWLLRYSWIWLLILYILFFVIMHIETKKSKNDNFKIFILVFIVITLPYWYIIFGTLRLWLLEPTRMNYRFNCYFRKNYYKYWTTADHADNINEHDTKDISHTLDVFEYHTKKSHSHLFTASLYGSVDKYVDNVMNMAQIIRNEYDEWLLRLYVDINVDLSVIDNVINISDNIEIFVVNDSRIDSSNGKTFVGIQVACSGDFYH